MAYVSKAEGERADWLTWDQALDHIEAADGCDRNQAGRQLRAALNDRVILVRFEDAAALPGGSTGPASPSDPGPPVASWITAEVNGAGEVWCDGGDWIEESARKAHARRRPFRLLAHSLRSVWPTNSEPPRQPKAGGSGPEPAAGGRKRTLALSVLREKYREGWDDLSTDEICNTVIAVLDKRGHRVSRYTVERAAGRRA